MFWKIRINSLYYSKSYFQWYACTCFIFQFWNPLLASCQHLLLTLRTNSGGKLWWVTSRRLVALLLLLPSLRFLGALFLGKIDRWGEKRRRGEKEGRDRYGRETASGWVTAIHRMNAPNMVIDCSEKEDRTAPFHIFLNVKSELVTYLVVYAWLLRRPNSIINRDGGPVLKPDIRFLKVKNLCIIRKPVFRNRKDTRFLYQIPVYSQFFG